MKKIFLDLIRLGIGHTPFDMPEQIDWFAVQALARKHGLSAVVLDGLDKLPPSSYRMTDRLKRQWIGEVLQNYEGRYSAYEKAIAGMAAFYNAHGYKMMVLKGYACSLDWPKPEHRPCGDIDIWQFGQQKEADEVISQEHGIKIDTSHPRHTVFQWWDFIVENHYDFVNVCGQKSSDELEEVLKDLAADDSYTVKVKGETVYLPSPNLHVLFLMCHMMNSFATAELTLRQILDWAFFIEKHKGEIDGEWLLGQLEKFHMKGFFNIVNAICVEDLGFSTEIFVLGVQYNPLLKEMVLRDLLSLRFTASEPRGLLKRLVYRYRRWRGNAWKRKMMESWH